MVNEVPVFDVTKIPSTNDVALFETTLDITFLEKTLLVAAVCVMMAPKTDVTGPVIAITLTIFESTTWGATPTTVQELLIIFEVQRVANVEVIVMFSTVFPFINPELPDHCKPLNV